MSFPQTIGPYAAAEAPGQYGPFPFGSTVYNVVVATAVGLRFLTVIKSADKGVTWTELDAAHRKQSTNNIDDTGPQPYTVAVVGTKFYVFYVDAAASTVISVAIFDTATGLWAANGATLATNFFVVGTSFFLNAVYRPASGDIVFVAPTGLVTSMGLVNHIFAQYALYNIAGNSWGAQIDLGYVDYTNVVEWNVVPCGAALDSDGRVVIATQQISRLSDVSPKQIQFVPGDNFFEVPADCILVNVGCTGAGGAGMTGGGGGGAWSLTTNINVTPGNFIPISVGNGGAGSGGDTNYNTGQIIAKGGSQAAAGVGGNGGQAAAGAGGLRRSGGNGGNSPAMPTGGGGGSVAGDAGNGGNGTDGTALSPGGPGVSGRLDGTGLGGAGGDVGAYGFDGNFPGGGAGGAGNVPAGTPGFGSGGLIQVFYVPNRGTDPGRLFTQCLLPGNTLATIQNTLITFPIGGQSDTSNTAIPFDMPFDMASKTGFVGAVVTGANNSAGFQNMLLLLGANADNFFFTLSIALATGNTANGFSACPALAFGKVAANSNLAYILYQNKTGPTDTFLLALVNLSTSLVQAVITVGSRNLGTTRPRVVSSGTSLLMEFGTPTVSVINYSNRG